MFKKIVVGVSGGVDSAVTALLLKNKGFDVLGAFMKNWDIIDETGTCTGERDFKDAQWVCDHLNIPIVEINFVKEFWNDVFSYVINRYQKGYTPNPDILCNRHIKFNKFLQIAREQYRADAIATGHYAKTNFGPYLEYFDAQTAPQLFQAADLNKDQTFFLSQIPPEALRYCMFPLGDYQKTDVKKIAAEAGLDKVAKKKESMGMCFIGKREFPSFIKEYIDDRAGDFIDFDTGKVVGAHKGIHHWTIGQRCKIGGKREPYFIMHKDVASGNIIVVAGEHPGLYSDFLITEKPHWFTQETGQSSQNTKVLDCLFRFQHRKPLIPCSVFQGESKLLVKLSRPARAITIGQFAVFYSDSQCLGGAEICYQGPSYAVLNKTVSMSHLRLANSLTDRRFRIKRE